MKPSEWVRQQVENDHCRLGHPEDRLMATQEAILRFLDAAFEVHDGVLFPRSTKEAAAILRNRAR